MGAIIDMANEKFVFITSNVIEKIFKWRAIYIRYDLGVMTYHFDLILDIC